MEKIAAIGIDPFLIPQQNRTPECLPPVQSCDLLSYLVLDTSFYTKEQFKFSEVSLRTTIWCPALLQVFLDKHCEINTVRLFEH